MDHASYDAAVAERVHEAFRAAGLSVREAALRSGIAYTTLDRKLKGAGFYVNELRRIGLLTGRTTESFLPDAAARSAKEPAA